MTNRLDLYYRIKEASASARTSVKAVGSGGRVKLSPHLLTMLLAMPAGYGVYRALDDVLKKKRD